MPDKKPETSFADFRDDLFKRLQAISKTRAIYDETLDSIKYASTPEELVSAIDAVIELDGIGGELRADMRITKLMAVAFSEE